MSSDPVSYPTNDSFEQFVQSALRRETRIHIEFRKLPELIEALRNGLEAAYPDADMGKIGGQLEDAFSFSCSNHGGLISSSQVLMGAMAHLMRGMNPGMPIVFAGPNIANVARGRCPVCGGTELSIVYDPHQILGISPLPDDQETAVSEEPPNQNQSGQLIANSRRKDANYLASGCALLAVAAVAWSIAIAYGDRSPEPAYLFSIMGGIVTILSLWMFTQAIAVILRIAPKCMECGASRLLFFGGNYAGVCVKATEEHPYPERIEEVILPGKKGSDFLCGVCANKREVRCRIHGKVTDRFSTSGVAPCKKCVEDQVLANEPMVWRAWGSDYRCLMCPFCGTDRIVTGRLFCKMHQHSDVYWQKKEVVSESQKHGCPECRKRFEWTMGIREIDICGDRIDGPFFSWRPGTEGGLAVPGQLGIEPVCTECGKQLSGGWSCAQCIDNCCAGCATPATSRPGVLQADVSGLGRTTFLDLSGSSKNPTCPRCNGALIEWQAKVSDGCEENAAFPARTLDDYLREVSRHVVTFGNKRKIILQQHGREIDSHFGFNGMQYIFMVVNHHLGSELGSILNRCWDGVGRWQS
jgi:hypothetical protein